LCASGRNAGGCDNQYPRREISGRFSVCNEDGYLFHAAVIANDLSVEYLPAVGEVEENL